MANGCGDPTHVEVGAPFSVAEVLTWRVAVEIVRRHPDRLWVVQTYPMDFYDALTIRPLRALKTAPGIDLNRLGAHMRVGWFGQPGDPRQPDAPILSWGNLFGDGDARDWLRHIDELAGLPASTHKLPASTPSSIALRWISAFLSTQLASRPRWRAHNTWFDGDPQQYLAEFPAAARFAEMWGPSGTAHVWILRTDDGSRTAAVCADGTLHLPGREPTDLTSAYRAHGSSILGLLGATGAELAR